MLFTVLNKKDSSIVAPKYEIQLKRQINDYDENKIQLFQVLLNVSVFIHNK